MDLGKPEATSQIQSLLASQVAPPAKSNPYWTSQSPQVIPAKVAPAKASPQVIPAKVAPAKATPKVSWLARVGPPPVGAKVGGKAASQLQKVGGEAKAVKSCMFLKRKIQYAKAKGSVRPKPPWTPLVPRATEDPVCTQKEWMAAKHELDDNVVWMEQNMDIALPPD
jgi:hypothetical protein